MQLFKRYKLYKCAKQYGLSIYETIYNKAIHGHISVIKFMPDFNNMIKYCWTDIIEIADFDVCMSDNYCYYYVLMHGQDKTYCGAHRECYEGYISLDVDYMINLLFDGRSKISKRYYFEYTTLFNTITRELTHINNFDEILANNKLSHIVCHSLFVLNDLADVLTQDVTKLIYELFIIIITN